MPPRLNCARASGASSVAKTTHDSLNVCLFGAFEARVNGLPIRRLRTRKSGHLLALLIIQRGRTVERSALAETLWPDCDAWAAASSLRRTLTDLRGALGSEAARILAPMPHSLSLDLTEMICDFVQFDSAMSDGSISALAAAVELYRAPLLEGCADEWIIAERAVTEERCLQALEALASSALRENDPSKSADYLRRAVAIDPLRETAQRALVELLGRIGDIAGMTVVYREFRGRMHRLMNAEPSVETTALYYKLLKAVDVEHRARGAAMDLDSLPRPLTPLIGREREIREVAACVEGNRVVTLTGPGGVGKTRLALAVAEAVTARSPDGVWFVDLSSVRDPALLPRAVAGALKIREEPDRQLTDTLCDALSFRSVLLVVDNCEHLRDFCASLVFKLIRSCGLLRVLATSREPLGISGERVWRVPGMSSPPGDDLARPAHGSSPRPNDHDGVRLFVDRAVAANQDFRESDQHSAAIAQICRMTDGNPLAIELAAAWVRVLPIEDIVSRLEDRLCLLSGGPGSSPERHQTLRAALDWSYELLSPEERRLLRWTSVFAGGWTMEAAEAVCGGGGTGINCVLHVVARLSDKSLLVYEEYQGRAGYRLLETVRQYALERLRDCGEAEAAVRAHAAHFAAAAARGGASVRGCAQVEQIARLDADHNNFRAALAWTREQTDRCVLGLEMAGALSWFWYLHGDHREGGEWLAAALGAAEHLPVSAAHSRALNGAGFLASRTGDYAGAHDWHAKALAAARSAGDQSAELYSLAGMAGTSTFLGDFDAAALHCDAAALLCDKCADPFAEGLLLLCRAVMAKNQGNYAQARHHLDGALRVTVRSGIRTQEGAVLHNLGNVTKDSGDAEGSRAYYERSLAIHQEIGDRYYQVINMYELANVAAEIGSIEEWGARAQAALALARDSGNRFVEAGCLHSLANRALLLCQVDEGVSYLASCLQLRSRAGLKREIACTLSSVGWLCSLTQSPRSAALLWGAQEALREQIGAPAPTAEDAFFERAHAGVRRALDAAGFDLAWSEGRELSLEGAIALATACVANAGGDPTVQEKRELE
jgi:predicted ATPase/DNA-binding SARP family transcriptional activator